MAPTLNYIGLVVADMPRSLAFYRLLGLDIPAEQDAEPHAECTLPGGMRICWDTEDTIRSFDPRWTPPAGGGRSAVGFECDTPAEVDKVYDVMISAGHHGHLAPWDAFWGMRYAVLHDPDGNGVDLYCTIR
ncbi:VOC family protein [Dactylosporangium aurantiacum]|uniref:VOC family protein n=1 Tax=Dactylosporangium aurantiacum TaxID=35754 RepID=A0A9Q9MFE4_9ACTN|nr:VOC family protein [Dactylosporangium aurantiacum]MDG6107555.1 VOC family protein [Dactylosporangium aurantiacum]UWZ54339.1 VOC family protein [Dactylosporangium aurantiacum]